jgi:hypothetical protein
MQTVKVNEREVTSLQLLKGVRDETDGMGVLNGWI